MHDEPDVIAMRGLSKRYGDVLAVDGLDLRVGRGEIYALIGRNGAGKTTTVRMLLGLVRPTSGDVVLLGAPLDAARERALANVGSLVEAATAYPNLTVRENLEVQRRLIDAPADAVEESIALLHLEPYRSRLAGQLSLGNRQRLALARALLHQPEVLVLDEPTNALDPSGIVEIRSLLRRLADERSVTVFISSHILAEVAHLADRIGIMHDGKLVEELDAAALRAKTRTELCVVVSDVRAAQSLLAERMGLTHVEQTKNGRLRIFEAGDRAAEVARTLVLGGLDLIELSHVEEDLEARFLRLTGASA